MTCDDLKELNLHESYALGRLTEEERTDYEDHVHSCKQCKTMLQIEIDFISEIRAVGKAGMKSEIMEQVRSRKTGTRWTIYAKVASIGFFLMLIPSLYYIYEHELDGNEAGPLKMEHVSYSDSDKERGQRTEEGNELSAPKSLEEETLPATVEKKEDISERESFPEVEAQSAPPSASRNRVAQPKDKALRLDLIHEEELDDELRQALSKPTDLLYFRRAFKDDVYVFQIGANTDKIGDRRQNSFDVTVERHENGQFSISFKVDTELYKIAEDSLHIENIDNGDMHVRISAHAYLIKLDPAISKGLITK